MASSYLWILIIMAFQVILGLVPMHPAMRRSSRGRQIMIGAVLLWLGMSAVICGCAITIIVAVIEASP
jgi:hypothetical protein